MIAQKVRESTKNRLNNQAVKTRFLYRNYTSLKLRVINWIYSGDDLLFRGLSQSTIGDTGFPCLVRDGTEGDSRSIITRINPANNRKFNQPCFELTLQAYV